MSDDTLFQKALEYVLRTPKTERQVRQWLFKKRVEGEFLPVDEIVGRLKELGYVNDKEYAANFTETKQGKLGKKSIQQKLVQKGVAAEIVDVEILEVGDQSELCKKLAEKYMRNKTPDQKTLQKLYRFLLNKGLEYAIISGIVNQFKGGMEDDRD